MPQISWSWACDQCPEVRAAHNKADRQAEYGVNWFEFIHTHEGINTMLSNWWNSLPTERRHEMLDKSILELEQKLDSLRKERNRF